MMISDVPNFLGIGAMKCGTTWIAEILNSHDEIFVAHGKELNYFSFKYKNGKDWYNGHFRNVKDVKAIGEFSVSYLMQSEDVSRRIYEYNPNMKLIVVVRDPVDRALSQYRWLIQRGHSLPPFSEAIKILPGLIGSGLYFKRMKPFWSRFPDSQILIIIYDEIKNNPRNVQKRLYAFLGVDRNYDSGLTNRVLGKTIYPRSVLLENMRSKSHSWLMENKNAFLITWFKKSGLSSLYRHINNKGDMKIYLSEKERKVIHDYFVDDLKRFYARTGLNISSWLQA